MDKSLGSTTAGEVRYVLHTMDDDTPISFEFIVGSFFPDAYQNMLSLLKDAHMEGYKQAMDELNEN